MVTHETVRINVAIQAQIAPDQEDSDFRKQVHSTLRKFVNGEWKIQSINRQKGNQFEGVQVRATVRVSEKEDYQLEARAAKVSKIGFELISPHAAYELTFDQIQEVNAKLRLTLIKSALIECTSYNIAFKDASFGNPKYRISSSRFDTGNTLNTGNSRNNGFGAVNAIMTSASPSPLGGSTMGSTAYQQEMTDEKTSDDGSVDMGVSTRFSMVGYFVLRSVPNAY